MWKRIGDFEKTLFAFKFASHFSGRPGFCVLCLAEQNHSSPGWARHWGGLQLLFLRGLQPVILGWSLRSSMGWRQMDWQSHS